MRQAALRTKGRASVDEAFWSDFWSSTKGGTEPAALDLGAARSLFQPAQMLALGKRILDAGELSVNVDGQLVPETTLPGLPDFQDTAGFDRYVGRVCEAFSAKSLTFTRDYCLKYDASVAAQVRSFIDGYIKAVGVPTPGVNAVFIAGHYKETWIGLHNDFCDTFLVPIHGHKNVLFWTPDYFDGRPELTVQSSFNGLCFGHTDVHPYREGAVTLTVGPGQVLFIPEKWWHYNILDAPETTLALSIGVFSNSTVADAVGGAITAGLGMPTAIERAEPWPRPPAGVVGSLSDVTLPRQLEQVLATLADSMRLQVLKLASSNGVLGAPSDPIRPKGEFSADSIICGRADSPVFLVPMGDEAGLLLAQGQMVRVPSADRLRGLVSALDAGQPFTAADVAGADVADWIEWLYERGALEKA